MTPVGYVMLQPAMRLDRPVKAYGRWMNRIPAVYREAVLDESALACPHYDSDPQSLATLKHYRGLMPMAMEARKPMFFLWPADGAIGSLATAAYECHLDFKALTTKIAERCGISVTDDATLTS